MLLFLKTNQKLTIMDNIPDSAKSYPGAPWDKGEHQPETESCDYCENAAQYHRVVEIRGKKYREKVCFFCLHETWQEEMKDIISFEKFVKQWEEL